MEACHRQAKRFLHARHKPDSRIEAREIDKDRKYKHTRTTTDTTQGNSQSYTTNRGHPPVHPIVK